MEQEPAAMAVSLPDDVVLEILVRVKDEPTLFRCATACKRWRHLVADPSFLRCRWPDQDYSSSLVGFFTWQHCEGDAFLKTCFIPMSRSPLGPDLRALGSFMTAAHGLFDRVVPLVSRHGLLLMRLEARNAHGHLDQNIFQLAVCCLLMGTCYMLPPLKFDTAITDYDEYEYCAYAVLTAADCGSNDNSSPPVLRSDSSFFKVVIITADYYDDLKYSRHMYSSDKARWSGHTNCFGTSSHIGDYGLFSDAIVWRGTARWLFRYLGDPFVYLINLNTQTGHISKMKLPFLKDHFNTSHASLTLGANGALSVLLMQNTCTQLDIWEQQEDPKGVGGTDSEWLCTRTIEQKELGEETQGSKLCIFREKCGTLLVKDGDHMYTIDVKTGRMVEFSNWPSKPIISPENAMPLEMEWPTIFISRLSAPF